MRTFVWPGHAYLPGITPRHPEGLFDALRDTVSEGMSAEELENSDAWLSGQGYYRAGFFWEAHEVWEPVWMALPPKSVERLVAQAAIQLANAGLKLRMEKPKAALRLCDEVEAFVFGLKGETLGLSMQWFADQVDEIRKEAGGEPATP